MKDEIIDRFLKQIESFKSEIKKVYLFGSRARGDEKPYSDYDLLLVVKERRPPMIDKLYDAVLDILLETGKVLSLKIFKEEEFEKLASIPTPFMSKVLKEGIVIG
jgi:predicted nucleotidyltransferase